jgi:biopolymer transport protein ExbB/TolQ
MIIIAPIASLVANAIIATALGITVGHFAVKGVNKVKAILKKKDEPVTLETPVKPKRIKKEKS